MVEKLLQKTIEEIKAENAKMMDEKAGVFYNTTTSNDKKEN